MRTLFGNEKNIKVARILNHTESPFELGPGDFVGDAEPVSVLQPPKPAQGHRGDGPAANTDREWKMPFPNISHQRREIMRMEAQKKQEHVERLVDGLPKDLAPRERRMAETFIRSRAHSFSKVDFDIGRTDIIKHRYQSSTLRAVA